MRQLSLFGNPEPPAPVASGVRIRVDSEAVTLAANMPAHIRLGASSWSFPGWPLWAETYSDAALVKHGLAAYAQHPLLRTVGVDRTWYRPVAAGVLSAMRTAVPPGFSFLVKAHEDVTQAVFGDHPRHGERRGQANVRFLDASYANDVVVGPFVEGLGGGVLLFPFAPQALPLDFPDRLHRFLAALPKGPWRYAVEVRNAALLTPAFREALAAADTVPALVAWSGMPSVVEQARLTGALDRPERVVRWMLAPGLRYEQAKAQFSPFERLSRPDPKNRAAVVEVLRGAKSAWVVINNKAEGCAPLSIHLLAQALAP